LDENRSDSSSAGDNYKKAKKAFKAMDSLEDSAELDDDVRSLPGEKKKKRKVSVSDVESDEDSDDDSDADSSQIDSSTVKKGKKNKV